MTHSPLFFYGTLRDKDILAAALGRQVPDTALISATAPGYAAVYVPDRFYPGLVPRNGAAADWTLERWTHRHRPVVLARETTLAVVARRGAGRR